MPLASWSRQSIIGSRREKEYTYSRGNDWGLLIPFQPLKSITRLQSVFRATLLQDRVLRKLLFRRVYTQSFRQANYQPSIIVILDWHLRTNNPRNG
jgi:hypothetical protein